MPFLSLSEYSPPFLSPSLYLPPSLYLCLHPFLLSSCSLSLPPLYPFSCCLLPSHPLSWSIHSNSKPWHQHCLIKLSSMSRIPPQLLSPCNNPFVSTEYQLHYQILYWSSHLLLLIVSIVLVWQNEGALHTALCWVSFLLGMSTCLSPLCHSPRCWY